MTQRLDRAVVIGAALELLDEVGVDAFSMRAVSRRLGVFDNAVHHHVRTRDELLVGVADLMLSQVALPDTDGLTWRDWLALLASSYRSVVARHPGAAMVLSDALPFAPSSQRLSAAVLTRLLDAGASPEQAAHGYHAFIAFLTGFIHVEATSVRRLRLPQLPAPDLSAYADQAHRAALSDAMAQLMVTAAELPPGVTVPDASFTAALDVVLDGIGLLLSAPGPENLRNQVRT